MANHPDILVELAPSGALRLSFSYDPYVVSLVKELPGRRWLPEAKVWTAPPSTFRALRELAAGANVGLAVSEELRAAFERGREGQAALAAAKADESPLPVPTATIVRPYQYAGIRYLTAALRNFKGALLGDDAGTGKSLAALAIVALHERLEEALILCPATLKWTWAAQIDEHFPQLDYVVIGGSWEQRAEQWASPARLKIANYDLLVPVHERGCGAGSSKKRRATVERGEKPICICGAMKKDLPLRTKTWPLIIADELVFLKDYSAQRTRRAKRLHAHYRLGLSGIPLENNLDELHCIMDWCIPGLLGPGYLFHQEHAITNRYGSVVGWQGIEKVRERIGPYYIRRRKADVLRDLPPKVYTDVAVELSAAEWTLYDAVRAQIKDAVAANPKLSAANILVMMLRLKQATADARLLNERGVPSSKVATLRDLIEASGDRQIVVFTFFAQFARLLAEEFAAPLIEGDVPPQRRAEIIAAFQRGEHKHLFSTDAGAYGVTLTAADVVVHMDLPWTPARKRQREDRLHRIGQRASVQVITLKARRTIDERIEAILHKKAELINAVLDEGAPEEDAVQMTRADVMGLLGND